MLTEDGRAAVAEALAQRLEGGSLEVVNGSQSARQAFDSSPEIADGLVRVAATFGEQDANFEWSERRVLDAAGTVIDAEKQDLGRKAEGAVMALTVEIEPLGEE